MFSSLSLALDQIRERGLTECVIEDSSGTDRIAYHTGKPTDVAAWLESAMLQLSGPLVVKAWSDEARKTGNPGTKNRPVHRWRLYGMHGQAAVPVIAGAAPAPVTGTDPAAAVDAAVAAARAEWDLRAAQDELRRMRAEIDALRIDDDDDNDDDNDEDQAAASVNITGQVEQVVTLLKQLLTPSLPAPTAAAPITGAPDAGDISEEERQLVAAIRNAKAQHPDATAEYIQQLLSAYGPKA